MYGRQPDTDICLDSLKLKKKWKLTLPGNAVELIGQLFQFLDSSRMRIKGLGSRNRLNSASVFRFADRDHLINAKSPAKNIDKLSKLVAEKSLRVGFSNNLPTELLYCGITRLSS